MDLYQSETNSHPHCYPVSCLDRIEPLNSSSDSLDCSRSSNLNGTISLSSPIQALALHLLENILTRNDLSKDNMLAIQVRSFHKLIQSAQHVSNFIFSIASTHGNEELRTIGVRSSVGHREQSTLSMLGLEVLIRKLLAVDRLAARALKERIEISRSLDFAVIPRLTLPRVKSPPWAMNPAITRWKAEPA